MTDKRPIDANALYEDVSRMGLTNGSTLERHSGMADAIAQMIQDAPTIDPESLRPVWRDPETDPPEVETEVLVLYRNDIDGYGITTAHYEDGSVFLQDSVWNWEDLPDWGTYDEERDDYKIPKGWWEYRHFNPDEVYNNQIDRPVVGWMPLPEKLKKEGVA